jgi:hypothetical protein
VRRTPQDRLVLAELLVDRIGLLVPRLAVGAGNDLAVECVADVGVGINMTEMRSDREGMPPALRAALITCYPARPNILSRRTRAAFSHHDRAGE